MHAETKASLAAKLASLSTAAASPASARAALDDLHREHGDLPKQLERKFARLPTPQQRVLLELVQAAGAREYVPLLQSVSRQPEVPLAIRNQAAAVAEPLGGEVDSPYGEALRRAADTLAQLQEAGDTALTAEGELAPRWQQAVLNLPIALACDLARELASAHPAVALAVLRSLRPIIDARDRYAFVETAGHIALPESAALLQDLLAEAAAKPLQKTIRRALHRLRAQGVKVPEGAEATRTARVGTVTHRLEKCLASHIDGAGDRVLWLIRTKPFGGYNVAYLILNYDTGIKEALRLQVSKRELPELLAKAQEHLPLIELDPIYGQHLVALAYTWNQETGTPVPEDFFLLLDVVGEPNTRFERPIIYAALSEADLQEAAAYRDRPAEILELPEFAGWTLPDSVTQKYGDRLRDIEESPLVVSEMTQQERIQEVYAQALEEVLDDRTRRLMQLRLEEMAYYLLRTGRRREALRAVAAARSLAEDDPQRLKRNPFVTALLERSLQRAKERPSRRIILPYTPPRPTREPEEERRLII